jgi:uroporphyrinogen III methyltransferase/synthase
VSGGSGEAAGASGRVILVGAGPGDPGLLTLRGAAALREADVVVYDALVSPEVLALAPEKAELVNVGKRGHEEPTVAQAETSALLVRLARAGRTVVRLKGGDPFVFGRGGEEASACSEAGVPFEVVPGVTAAIGAPAYAGIPVTDRRHAASFAVVTGHRDPTEPTVALRWGELARGGDTLVVLMGMKHLAAICERLIAEGRAPATPAAAIEWGTTARQRVLEAPLAELAARVAAAGFGTPTTVVIGDVVALRRSLAWREALPLYGWRVLVTRAEEQAGALAEALRRAGAEPIVLPTIRIVPVVAAELEERLAALDRYDLVVLTSANAVRHLARAAAARGVGLDGGRLRAVCVGPVTAAAAQEAGLAVELVPPRFDAEGVLEALAQRYPLAGRRILLPRAERAREVLPEGLRRAGATVDTLVVYRTEPAALDAPALRDRLGRGELHALTFTSPSTVRHFFAALDEPARAATRRCVVAAIGPVTAGALAEIGRPADVVAEASGASALVEALVRARAARAEREIGDEPAAPDRSEGGAS